MSFGKGTFRGVLLGAILAGILSLAFLSFYNSNSYYKDVVRLNKEMLTLEDRMSVKAGNWVHYLEGRVNRFSQSQDEYQISTSKRIDYLNEKIILLEKKVRQLEKDINKIAPSAKTESIKN